MKNDVSIYGGFSGDEISLGERNWESNLTILSGDIDNNDRIDEFGLVNSVADIVGDNAYHVVTGIGLTETAVLDGFTINAGSASGPDDPSKYGGGFYNFQSSPTINNVIFLANSAGDFGGGLYNYDHSMIRLNNVTFEKNRAWGRGGGIYSFNSGVILNHGSILNNESSYSGGGIYDYTNSLEFKSEINDTVFRGNKGSMGGGLYSGGPIVVNNSSFSENFAGQAGGGIYEGGLGWYNGITLTDNVAGNGGGLFVEYNTPIFENIFVFGNTASNEGGGIGSHQSNPTFINGTIEGNTAKYGGGISGNRRSAWTEPAGWESLTVINNYASESGGGIHFEGGNHLLKNSFLKNNSAAVSGGGIYNYLSEDLFLENCILADNSSLDGGGIYNYQSSLELKNSTITLNSATNFGGALYNYLSVPVISNSILWDNAAPAGSEIYNNSSSTTITYSDVKGGYSGTGNLNANPLFMNELAGNFRVSHDSPVIDMGDNSKCTVEDFDEIVRPVGSGCDMGAFEKHIFANEDFFIVKEDSPTVIDVLSNDIIAGSTQASISDIGDPDNGGICVTDGDFVTYTPTIGVGEYESFSYQVSDNLEDMSSAIVQIKISSPPSIFSSGLTVVTNGDQYLYSIQSGDVDIPDGDSLKVTAPIKPDWLSLTDHGDGTATLSGIPSVSDVGTHLVKILVTDSVGLIAEQEYLVTVEGPQLYFIFLPSIIRN
jgi:predicted outer membrane repeat protein